MTCGLNDLTTRGASNSAQEGIGSLQATNYSQSRTVNFFFFNFISAVSFYMLFISNSRIAWSALALLQPGVDACMLMHTYNLRHKRCKANVGTDL
jgi:hypothetical protein